MGEKIPDLHVRGVDREVWEAFKRDAVRRRGKLHGVLGEELTKAMLLYLEYTQKDYAEENTVEEEKRDRRESYDSL